MNFIQYVKQLWKNGPGGGTPWSAARLNHMEDGIKANNDMISELNSNMITNSTKLLETPTEYIENISNSDYSLCLRNNKTVILIFNIRVLKQLSAYTTYLTLPKQYIPPYVIFAPTISGTGIRIGMSGEVMPCMNIKANEYIQTVVSYILK